MSRVPRKGPGSRVLAMSPGSQVPGEGSQVEGPGSRVPRIGPVSWVPGLGRHFSGMPNEFIQISWLTLIYWIFFFCLKGIWNIFLPFMDCAIKFIYVVVLSIIAETAFLWYLENNSSYWLKMWLHQFLQAEQATSKMSALRHRPFKFWSLLLFSFCFCSYFG